MLPDNALQCLFVFFLNDLPSKYVPPLECPKARAPNALVGHLLGLMVQTIVLLGGSLDAWQVSIVMKPLNSFVLRNTMVSDLHFLIKRGVRNCKHSGLYL